MAAKKYTALVGVNVPPDDTRYEPGDELFLTDAKARPLLALGAIERITETHEHEDDTANAVAAAQADLAGDGQAPVGGDE